MKGAVALLPGRLALDFRQIARAVALFDLLRLAGEQRRFQAPAPVIDEAEAVQCVQIVDITMQDRVVKPLRLVELAALVRAQRTPQHSRKIWLQGLRRAIAHPVPPHASGMSPWFLRP